MNCLTVPSLVSSFLIALLVAARIFNFNRTIRDIMKVVRIGEGTIKKR